MTTKVTKESLAENIGRLESYGDLSLNEEYQLKAYPMLLAYMKSCSHAWLRDEYGAFQCEKCGESWEAGEKQQECGATRAPGEDDQHAHMVD